MFISLVALYGKTHFIKSSNANFNMCDKIEPEDKVKPYSTMESPI